MPGTYKRKCIVLKQTKLKEKDAIITLFASDGSQVRAVAKGLRRPGSRYGAYLEPFSLIEAQLYSGKNLDTICELRCIKTNAECRKDVEVSSAAMCMCQLLEKVTNDGAQADERIFALTLKVFEFLGQHPAKYANILSAAHMIKALAMLGVSPLLHTCAICGNDLQKPARYSLSAGGALCESCAGGAACGEAYENNPALWSWVDFLLHHTFEEIVMDLEQKSAPSQNLHSPQVLKSLGVDLLEFTQDWAKIHLFLNLSCIDFLLSLQ